MSTSITYFNRRRRKAAHADLLIPWRNGYYKAETFKFWLFYVKGTECTIEWACGKPTNITSYFQGSFKLGRFKMAHPDVIMQTAKFNYNVEITLFDETVKIHAMVNDDGTKFTFCAWDNKLDSFELQNEERSSYSYNAYLHLEISSP